MRVRTGKIIVYRIGNEEISIHFQCSIVYTEFTFSIKRNLRAMYAFLWLYHLRFSMKSMVNIKAFLRFCSKICWFKQRTYYKGEQKYFHKWGVCGVHKTTILTIWIVYHIVHLLPADLKTELTQFLNIYIH